MPLIPFQVVKSKKIKELTSLVDNLKDQIKSASNFIHAIEEGNLDAKELSEMEQHMTGELSEALVSLQKQMKSVSEEEDQRHWVSETRSNFMEILRNRNEDLKELSNAIIKHLVNSLNANQGGLFLVNDENPDDIHLELLACYAYARKKYLTKRIEIGEGLVGQIVREKEYMYFTEIPENYFKISSGLGEGTPRHLLIVPLKIEEEVYGAIELGSFRPIKQYEINFVLQLGETIASTISTVKNNTRTKRLLTETQQQAEEMKSQQEELQQNMEELETTQEEMQRRSGEIESRMTAVDESGMSSVEFELDGTILSANDNFLDLMGYTSEEVEGRHHRMFVPDKEANSDEYKQFWIDLANGKTHSGEFERVDKKGKKKFLSGSYSIIKDKKGNPLRILKLANDITNIKNFQLELQDQAEQMSAQDEELRQNLEEITATQEEMQRRTSEIESRIKAVDESGISSVEFEPDGTIISANDNFVNLMGYTKEEVQGKHHRIFVPEKIANSEAYQQFWTDLANGKMHNGEFERVDKNGNKVFLNGSYSIIKNSEGKTERILKLATDITEIKLGQFELRAQAEQMQEQDDIMRDNIERLTATQKEMQDNQKFISDLIDATDDNIFTVDRDHKILLFNKAFRDVWEAQGVHVEKGLSINEIFDKSEIKAHSELIDKALRGEKMSIEVDKMIGGNSIRIHVTYSSIRNEIGEIIAAAIFAKNMSEG